ncbi:MAG: hypothetical protein B6D56_05250 [Candidatus Omnitrophica bacterium 4484_70.1]|nr:MAG: hypothetical protein B6D56_05250 [Candidatus Omnitrophica bacterium 4484_70.1]
MLLLLVVWKMKKVFGILFFLFPTFVVFPQIKEDLRKEAESYRQKGYEFQCKGDISRALEYYQKAISLNPLFTDVYNDLGVVYEMLGEKEKALEMYKRSLEIDPHYLPVYTNLALFYEEQGNKKKAIFYWRLRYFYGKRGEYWQKVARNHLFRLDTEGKIKREILKYEAKYFSQEVSAKLERVP